MADSAALPDGGTIRPITRWGEDVMHRVQQPVTDFGAELQMLVADMFATMYAADGVGLAACQIGVDLALFVYDCPDDDEISHRGAVCNPVLHLPAGRNRSIDRADEGCLSLPGAFVTCGRPDTAYVTGLGVNGKPVRVNGTGLLARCLQHETDHCNGVVFADHLPQRSKRRLFRHADDEAERFPAGWPVNHPRRVAM